MRRLSAVFVTALLVAMIATPSLASDVTLVNGQGKIVGKIRALSQSNQLLIDLYDFFRALNSRIEWDRSLHRLEVFLDGFEYRFYPGQHRVYSGGKIVDLPGTPDFRNGRLFIEPQAVANLLRDHSSRSMIWNPSRKRLQLTTQSLQPSPNDDPIGRIIEEPPATDKDQFLVVIDPGHGGRDPGAIGANGLREKNVVLEMGRTLKRFLDRNFPDVKARLTRSDDRFLALKTRTQIANEMEADLFVSLHANSGFSSYASGFEVFTLSGEATDPSAEDLAEIENSALLYEGYKKEEIDDLTWILWQLRSTVHTRESRKVAKMMLGQMDNQLPISNRGMKQAPFWVLKDAQMPAVLVESGFLSNPSEERRLRSKQYHRALAEALSKAINQFQRQRF